MSGVLAAFAARISELNWVAKEIISVAQMRALDAGIARAGTPTHTLMERAGAAVASVVAERFPGAEILIVCGPGKNGGDGYVAARILKDWGWRVEVATCGYAPADADTKHAAAAWNGPTHNDAPADWRGAVVDALFGAGLSRPLEGAAARFAASTRAIAERVVAVDVPSGVGGDTGIALGDVAVHAGVTVTFMRKKLAHVLFPGRAHCGQVIVRTLGEDQEAIAALGAATFENSPDCFAHMLIWPSWQTHKHARGHAIVASGGHARTGAARLSAGAALRAGAGLVTVLSPPAAMAENAAHLTAVMLREADSAYAYEAAWRDAACGVIGPAFGLSDAHKAIVHASAQQSPRCPLVFDADAITLLAPIETPLDARDVLTPHVGEFKRAFPGVLESSATRVDAARTAAVRAGCVVVLKGADTVIAAPDGRALINTTGTPFLSTAGAGDVLAGLIAGAIAQGAPSFEAAGFAAWLHGRAGERLGPGLTADDMVGIIANELNELAPALLRRRERG